MARRDAEYWIHELQALFEDVGPSLTEVLDAWGCREGWLQGEAFRFFRRRGKDRYDFRVNELPLVLDDSNGKSKKADLAFYVDNELACFGELKLYGTAGYYAKNLTGGAQLGPYLAKVNAGETVVFRNDASLEKEAQGGLLWDYYRLVKHQNSKNAGVSRLLVLVLDRREQPDDFGRVISNVEFEKPAKVLLSSPALLVKVWALATPTV